MYSVWEYYEFYDESLVTTSKNLIGVFNTEEEAEARIIKEKNRSIKSLSDLELRECQKFIITQK